MCNKLIYNNIKESANKDDICKVRIICKSESNEKRYEFTGSKDEKWSVIANKSFYKDFGEYPFIVEITTYY